MNSYTKYKKVTLKKHLKIDHVVDK